MVNMTQQLFPDKVVAIRQRGVGMIEVLVTLFILSVGLLGVASLQFISAFSNADALNRSQSVMVAQQFSERLRASSVMSATGDGMVLDADYYDDGLYNFANLSCTGGGQPYPCFCLEHPAGVPNCRDNECSASQMAAFDAYEVSCSAVATNPTVSVELACDDNNVADADVCSAGSRHTIKLSWPVENWQNIDRELNADCTADTTEPHDCVVLEVTL